MKLEISRSGARRGFFNHSTDEKWQIVRFRSTLNRNKSFESIELVTFKVAEASSTLSEFVKRSLTLQRPQPPATSYEPSYFRFDVAGHLTAALSIHFVVIGLIKSFGRKNQRFTDVNGFIYVLTGRRPSMPSSTCTLQSVNLTFSFQLTEISLLHVTWWNIRRDCWDWNN